MTATTASAAVVLPPPAAELSAAARMARYTGVNLLATVVDCGLFFALVHAVHNPTESSVVAYAASILLNYALTKKFVFAAAAGGSSDSRRFLQFLATGALGLILTAAITALGTGPFALAPAAAKGIALLVCFVVLYFVRSRLVFKA